MRSILFSTAAVVLSAAVCGCTVTAEPASAPPPPPPTAPVYASEPPAPPPPAAPALEDEDVEYDNVAPPVANIEMYPSVVYGGAPVYYVNGVWYRHGARGWGRYRAEPPALSHVRMSHAREDRWVRQGPPRPAPPGAAQMQRRPAPPVERPAPPAREVR